MKKGFTLVELLGVVTLLGIILTISVPFILNILDTNEAKYYEKLDNMVETSTKTYLSENSMFLPKRENQEITFDITDTKLQSYFSKPPVSVDDNACTGVVKVKRIDRNKYTYKACLQCDDYVSPNC